ncbi:hypothetical protein Pelo_5582 [Pelomyxa schiedti]|nr:hypothetical protein Pelo_5582 [Pelomyxa schiedti]
MLGVKRVNDKPLHAPSSSSLCKVDAPTPSSSASSAVSSSLPIPEAQPKRMRRRKRAVGDVLSVCDDANNFPLARRMNSLLGGGGAGDLSAAVASIANQFHHQTPAHSLPQHQQAPMQLHAQQHQQQNALVNAMATSMCIDNYTGQFFLRHNEASETATAANAGANANATARCLHESSPITGPRTTTASQPNPKKPDPSDGQHLLATLMNPSGASSWHQDPQNPGLRNSSESVGVPSPSPLASPGSPLTSPLHTPAHTPSQNSGCSSSSGSPLFPTVMQCPCLPQETELPSQSTPTSVLGRCSPLTPAPPSPDTPVECLSVDKKVLSPPSHFSLPDVRDESACSLPSYPRVTLVKRKGLKKRSRLRELNKACPVTCLATESEYCSSLIQPQSYTTVSFILEIRPRIPTSFDAIFHLLRVIADSVDDAFVVILDQNGLAIHSNDVVAKALNIPQSEFSNGVPWLDAVVSKQAQKQLYDDWPTIISGSKDGTRETYGNHVDTFYGPTLVHWTHTTIKDPSCKVAALVVAFGNPHNPSVDTRVQLAREEIEETFFQGDDL